MWNEDNAIYDDGDWITWSEIDSHLARLEFEAAFPHLDVDLVPIFRQLLEAAQNYFHLTGRHLQVYGDLGELYGAIVHGVKLHRNYAQGSDGKIGDEFVEIKTLTPFKSNDIVTLNMDRNFSAVLIVKIDENFEISSKLIKRKDLPKGSRKLLRLNWGDFANTPEPSHRLHCPG